MKKRLLKPPQNDGEIFNLPAPGEFASQLKAEHLIATAHQPYFFNPGVSAKFIFLDNLPEGKKQIIFVDTDRIKLEVKVPSRQGIDTISFINTDEVLSGYPTPGQNNFIDFLSILESNIREVFSQHPSGVISNLLSFKEILLSNIKRGFLKDVLAESFLQFYNLKLDYEFFSNLTKGKEFEDFFLRIYKEEHSFRTIFNESLDDYRKEFRFRYKNFPFPRLQEGELPFWVLKDGRRIRCFSKDVDSDGFRKLTILPRASTLTIFLRLYKLNFFIHGIGGTNYEWVQDRVIKRFFKQEPAPYTVVSGTFLLDDFKEREFPYFFFNPRQLRDKVRTFIEESTNRAEARI